MAAQRQFLQNSETVKAGTNEPKGVLAIWNDVDPGHEIEYNEWYFQDHLPERVGIPGFLSGRRYEFTGRGPKYFTFYLTRSVEILRSPEYMQRVNQPTEWTRRAMALFRDMCRTACSQTIDLGRAIGGAAVTMELKPAPEDREGMRKYLAETLFPDLLQSPGRSGVIRCRLWEADPEVTIQKTAEQDLRGVKDKLIDWVIVIEASSSDQVEKAGQGMAAVPFAARGAKRVEPFSVYRLLHYFPGPDGR